MNVLLTGGAGFVGSHITRQLIQAGHCPIIIDNLSNGYKEAIPEGVLLHVANIGDAQFLENFFTIHEVDSVIHCAALIDVNESVRYPSKYYQNNVAQSINLLQACERANVKSFIFSSSAAVYGQPEKTPIEETDPAFPINPYGETKFMFEKILQSSCNSPSSKMKYVIFRYFNVAGADTSGEMGPFTKDAFHLIKVACEVVAGYRDHIKIYGTDYPTHDGTCIRDFIHVEDLAIAHVQAIDHLSNGGASDIFNCGYGNGFSVREVLETMKQVSGIDIPIVESEYRAGDPFQLMANSKKNSAGTRVETKV